YHLEPTQFLLIWSTYLAWTGESVFAMWHDYKTWQAERKKAAAHKAPQAQALFWTLASALSLGTYGVVYLLNNTPVLTVLSSTIAVTFAGLAWLINRKAPAAKRVTIRSAWTSLGSPKGITTLGFLVTTAIVATTIGLGPIPVYAVVGSLIAFAVRGLANVALKRFTNLPPWAVAALKTIVALTWMVNLTLHLPAAFATGGLPALVNGLFAAADALFLVGAVPAALDGVATALPATWQAHVTVHVPANQFTRWAGWLSVPTITVAAGLLGYTLIAPVATWLTVVPVVLVAGAHIPASRIVRKVSWITIPTSMVAVGLLGSQIGFLTGPWHAVPIAVLTGAFVYLTQSTLAATPLGKHLAARNRLGAVLLSPWQTWKGSLFLNAPNTGGLALAAYGLYLLWTQHLTDPRGVTVITTAVLAIIGRLLYVINRRAGPSGPSTPGTPGTPGGPATPGTPGTPATPAAPAAPATPGTPAAPATPASPAASAATPAPSTPSHGRFVRAAKWLISPIGRTALVTVVGLTASILVVQEYPLPGWTGMVMFPVRGLANWIPASPWFSGSTLFADRKDGSQTIPTRIVNTVRPLTQLVNSYMLLLGMLTLPVMSVDFWVNATFLDANASFFVIGTVAAIAGWHGRKNPTRTSKKWKHVARWTTNNAYLAVLASIPLMGIQLTEPNYHLEPTQFLLIWSTYLAWTGESVFAMWHDY
ncbi:hypothetical protein, partial [Pseudonocardia spinosispora]|uniref:hypothetical protein n=1 Tax=Pseudonocardia spinosispora TaxID=103441 RepID=UPI00056C59F2